MKILKILRAIKEEFNNFMDWVDVFSEQWHEDYDVMSPEQKAYFWMMQDRFNRFI